MFEQPQTTQNAPPPQTIVIQQAPSRGWIIRLLLLVLGLSLSLNFSQLVMSYLTAGSETSGGSPAIERFHSGETTAEDKIAILEISGTIMPPFTERFLDTIEQIENDDDVKGVVLLIDSPGGLVADSHQIYHRLEQLRERRTELPIYVSMSRMAASGGYYVAMGAGPEGKIYAEPTTWTGSIGVIIPRYDVSKLASDFGVRAEPLTTGPFKDSMSPFRELSAEERVLWEEIMDDSFQRFQQVIVDGRRNLDEVKVRELATGRIFTADQAKANGLIDEVGYLEDAIDALQAQLGLSEARVVKYEYPATLADLLLGSAQARQPVDPWRAIMESSVPRAMYFCGWNAGLGEGIGTARD
jgi:protease-4